MNWERLEWVEGRDIARWKVSTACRLITSGFSVMNTCKITYWIGSRIALHFFIGSLNPKWEVVVIITPRGSSRIPFFFIRLTTWRNFHDFPLTLEELSVVQSYVRAFLFKFLLQHSYRWCRFQSMHNIMKGKAKYYKTQTKGKLTEFCQNMKLCKDSLNP